MRPLWRLRRGFISSKSDRSDAWSPHYPWGVDVAWRWIVSGVLTIGVGLAVWPTTFILVPAGVVFVAIGVTKWVRSIWATHSRSR